MTARLTLAALLLVFGLPLLGYLWPLPQATSGAAATDNWAWPENAAARQPTQVPANLANYWPGKNPAHNNTNDARTAAGDTLSKAIDWQLIGIISQGKSLSALVQDPEGNILKLQAGDSLDPQRRVSVLEATRLHWHDDNGRTGELPLYPASAPEQSGPR